MIMKNVGTIISENFLNRDYKADYCVLCKNHRPFSWRKDAKEAEHRAVVMEKVEKIACRCKKINSHATSVQQALIDEYSFCKHGTGAYYG